MRDCPLFWGMVGYCMKDNEEEHIGFVDQNVSLDDMNEVTMEVWSMWSLGRSDSRIMWVYLIATFYKGLINGHNFVWKTFWVLSYHVICFICARVVNSTCTPHGWFHWGLQEWGTFQFFFSRRSWVLQTWGILMHNKLPLTIGWRREKSIMHFTTMTLCKWKEMQMTSLWGMFNESGWRRIHKQVGIWWFVVLGLVGCGTLC